MSFILLLSSLFAFELFKLLSKSVMPRTQNSWKPLLQDQYSRRLNSLYQKYDTTACLPVSTMSATTTFTTVANAGNIKKNNAMASINYARNITSKQVPLPTTVIISYYFIIISSSSALHITQRTENWIFSSHPEKLSAPRLFYIIILLYTLIATNCIIVIIMHNTIREPVRR